MSFPHFFRRFNFSIISRFFASLIVLSIASCESKKTADENIIVLNSSVSTGKKIEVGIDTVSIPLNFDHLNSYSVYAADEKSGMFIGYNQGHHKLDYFDLARTAFVKTVELEKDGPDAIIDIQSFVIGKRNEIVFITTNKIIVSDSTGHILKYFTTATGSSDFLTKNALYPFQSHNFYFDSENEKVYCGNVSYVHGQCDPEHFSVPIIAVIDLKSNEVSSLSVHYPKEFLTNSYGFLFEFGFTFDKQYSLVTYNFAGSSTIYQYDMIKKIHRQINSPSEYTKNMATAVSWEECENVDMKVKHWLENPKFLKIRSSLDEKFFYRLHSKEMVYEKGPDGKFPNMNSMLSYLTIYDRDFAILQEMELGNGIYPDCAFVLSDGLYVTPMIDRTKAREEELKFIRYRIQAND